MDAKQLYTEKIDTYQSFNSVFRSPQALQAFFQSYEPLRSDLRILDARCGTGAASIALLNALRRRNLTYQGRWWLSVSTARDRQQKYWELVESEQTPKLKP